MVCPPIPQRTSSSFRIREARALRILESQSRKNKEKGRISRAAQGVSGKKMTSELGKLGLPLDISQEVSG